MVASNSLRLSGLLVVRHGVPNSASAPLARRRVQGALRHLLAIAVLGLALPAAAETAWFDKPYGYVVIDQDVRAALTEFGRNLHLPVVMSDAVKGRIRGEVSAEKAGPFLDRLAAANGLTWYFDGAVLNVSAESEFATRVLNTGRLGSKAVAAEMRQLGLFDERFTLRASPDGRVLTVSGPPAYVAAVEQLVQRMQPPPMVAGDDPRVRLFRGGMATEVVAAPGAAASAPPPR